MAVRTYLLGGDDAFNLAFYTWDDQTHQVVTFLVTGIMALTAERAGNAIYLPEEDGTQAKAARGYLVDDEGAAQNFTTLAEIVYTP